MNERVSREQRQSHDNGIKWKPQSPEIPNQIGNVCRGVNYTWLSHQECLLYQRTEEGVGLKSELNGFVSYG